MSGVSPFLTEKTRRKASSRDVDVTGRLAGAGPRQQADRSAEKPPWRCREADVLCVKSFGPRKLLALGTVDTVILVHSFRPLLSPMWKNRPASGCFSSQTSSHPGCYLLLSSPPPALSPKPDTLQTDCASFLGRKT